MREEDNAVPKDSVLKHQNYEKIEMVPSSHPSFTENSRKELTQGPPYLRQPGGVLGKKMWRGRENLVSKLVRIFYSSPALS